jgi:small subunit ribosomal protein S19
MARSIKKGPYVHTSILKHMRKISPHSRVVIKTWSRDSLITPDMIGYLFAVHNGRTFTEVRIMEDMVGHHLGEFAPTRKFIRHGGRMQKEIEQKAKEAETSKEPSPKTEKK